MLETTVIFNDGKETIETSIIFDPQLVTYAIEDPTCGTMFCVAGRQFHSTMSFEDFKLSMMAYKKDNHADFNEKFDKLIKKVEDK